MVAYDKKVIQEFADRLYRAARTTVFTYTMVGALAGCVVLGMTTETAAVAVAVLASGYLGYQVGRERSFKMRLEAQQALCQAQIEENTRANGQPA